MLIEKRIHENGDVTLSLSGKLDTITSGLFRKEAASVPEETKRLILDLRETVYISSSGLRELLICRKRFPEERMLIRNITAPVREILEMTGFDLFLPIEEASEDGMAQVFQSFKALLKSQRQNHGNRVVLRDERESYTWEDIDRASQIIAQDLAELGVGRGSHVGICGENSVSWILTFFAVQKLEALAMLINPAQSAQEIGRVCTIGDITCLCCGTIPSLVEEDVFLADIQKEDGCQVESLYSFQNLNIKKRFPEYEEIKNQFTGEMDADAPCVVIFTSGSTGRPKGVILSAYNILNGAQVQVKMQKVTDKDKGLLVAPLFHILGMIVCFLPCAMTNAQLFVPENTHTATIIRTMKREKCTLLHSVPTLIAAILRNPDFDPDAFSQLRCTLLAGSACSEEQLSFFRKNLPGNHFMIAYGLSEMAPVSETLYEDTDEHLKKTVGRQVDNIQIRIRDRETGRECATGEAGEIVVQGYQLMTGYYKLPLKDQAIDEDGWLLTGDMGYLREDGYLVLTGRYKDLIVRGGENIMPLEVEQAVSSLEEVEDVKVIGVPNAFYGEEVCACVKLKKGASWDENEARVALRSCLAPYKIPSRFVLFDTFPLLGSGKIDIVSMKEKVLMQ